MRLIFLPAPSFTSTGLLPIDASKNVLAVGDLDVRPEFISQTRNA